MTVLYPSPVFGPVHSRRLGVSLGVNLMPSDGKVCTFDCIYCECGLNKDFRPHTKRPAREEVASALESILSTRSANNEPLDVITFAGNGEPTAHPQFAGIIEDTIRLRDMYFPKAKVSVLSNATMLHKADVREALMRVDNNILKLDTVSPIYINKVDRPTGHYSVSDVIDNMKLFDGHLIVQTMFMKGTATVDGEAIDADNTSEDFIAPWLETLKEIRPEKVMVYTIDRETPAQGLQKATREELDKIRDRVMEMGIECSASY